MEYVIRLTDENEFNKLSFNIGFHAWESRGQWDHFTNQGFHAVKVPVKGRSRWIKRSGRQLERLGFKLVKE